MYIESLDANNNCKAVLERLSFRNDKRNPIREFIHPLDFGESAQTNKCKHLLLEAVGMIQNIVEDSDSTRRTLNAMRAWPDDDRREAMNTIHELESKGPSYTQVDERFWNKKVKDEISRDSEKYQTMRNDFEVFYMRYREEQSGSFIYNKKDRRLKLLGEGKLEGMKIEVRFGEREELTFFQYQTIDNHAFIIGESEEYGNILQAYVGEENEFLAFLHVKQRNDKKGRIILPNSLKNLYTNLTSRNKPISLSRTN